MTVQAIRARPKRRGLDLIARQLNEGQTHRALVQQIQVRQRPDVFWAHIPNGEKRSSVTGAILQAMGVKRGVPDLIFVIEGRAHFLELKRLRGRRSVDQVAVHAQIGEAGGVVATAYGLDAALDQLMAWGAIR